MTEQKVKKVISCFYRKDNSELICVSVEHKGKRHYTSSIRKNYEKNSIRIELNQFTCGEQAGSNINKLEILGTIKRQDLEFECIERSGGVHAYIILKGVDLFMMKKLIIPVVSGLNDASKHIYRNNKEKGFWDKPRELPELLMLIVSELSEALEADRNNSRADSKAMDELYDVSNEEIYLKAFRASMKDTVEDEIADAVIRLLDLCGGLGIDIQRHINAKLAYNRMRPRLHGKSY